MLQPKYNKKCKVVVAMSGGVDSSLAAALLKRGGYDVIGVTFRMWPKEECGADTGRACCSLEAMTRARAVASELDIPYYAVDFSSNFKKEVIDYFCREYLRGMTPNPCIVCNEKIKFGALLDKARSLGARYVATGHYARVGFDKKRGRFVLRSGKNGEAEQSYFLSGLSQEQLGCAIFPLGGFAKDRTRALAKRYGIKTFDAVSSQDICFTQNLDYAEYIRKRTQAQMKPGDIVDSKGNVLGRHKGIPFYTVGQRRGLGIAHSERLYVTSIDTANNRIIVGSKKDILKPGLLADRMNWIAAEPAGSGMKAMVKIRYNYKKAKATVKPLGDGTVKVVFDHPQEAPTPGQAVVFYHRDLVLGGGWIKSALEKV